MLLNFRNRSLKPDVAKKKNLKEVREGYPESFSYCLAAVAVDERVDGAVGEDEIEFEFVNDWLISDHSWVKVDLGILFISIRVCSQPLLRVCVF